MLLDVFNRVISYELYAVEMKNIIDKYDKYLVSKVELDELRSTSDKVFLEGHDVIMKIKALKESHKQLSRYPFIFKKKVRINSINM